MREILFRGFHECENGTKTITVKGKQYRGEWVEGDYVRIKDGGNPIEHYIYGKAKVIPETVGEYTGLTDQNGKRIFEGDILVFVKGATHPFKIAWDGIGWKMYRADGKRIKYAFECDEVQYMRSSEVIGTIYDNPELLDAPQGSESDKIDP